MLFFTKTYGTNATVALAETQLVLVDHQVIRLDKCFTPMPLGQTARSIKDATTG
jgi:hypothetical protein